MTFTIQNYEINLNTVSKKAQNYFKILEKKQKVRLNFVDDVNKRIFNPKEKEREE